MKNSESSFPDESIDLRVEAKYHRMCDLLRDTVYATLEDERALSDGIGWAIFRVGDTEKPSEDARRYPQEVLAAILREADSDKKDVRLIVNQQVSRGDSNLWLAESFKLKESNVANYSFDIVTSDNVGHIYLPGSQAIIFNVMGSQLKLRNLQSEQNYLEAPWAHTKEDIAERMAALTMGGFILSSVSHLSSSISSR